MRVPAKTTLESVYGESQISGARFENLARCYQTSFGEERMEFFSAPGRTEIIGNHTDHNGGKVIAASIDMDTIGAAYPNDTDMIEIISEGYPDKIVVDIGRVDEIPINQGTLSLTVGIVKAVKAFGFQISGFRAYLSTDVISSAGVSSSASFEMLLCAMINYFFNEEKMEITTYAKIGQYAENHYWSKASGLMDQMACAAGGVTLLDFAEEVSYRRIDFTFELLGYNLVIVNTGRGHADLSHEYSAIPLEMKQVAAALRVSRLSQSSLDEMLGKFAALEKNVQNDRAIMRAFHFFEENARVEQAAAAIEAGDGSRFLELLGESGNSSWELLENCSVAANYQEQKIALYLALTKIFLKKNSAGCCRVHGGGFAGVIMCVVPEGMTAEYIRYISEFAGAENVYPMKIRSAGAIHLDK